MSLRSLLFYEMNAGERVALDIRCKTPLVCGARHADNVHEDMEC